MKTANCCFQAGVTVYDKEHVKIPVERIQKYFPKDYTTTQMEETIVKLCEAYHRKRLRDRDSR